LEGEGGRKKEKGKRRTLRNDGLQLPPAHHQTQLLPRAQRAPAFLAHLDDPASAVAVLGVLPQWPHARAEEVHAGLEREVVPGEVVVDLVEGGDVGHGRGEQRRRAARARLGVPEAEDVLEGERPHALEHVLVEEGRGAGAGWGLRSGLRVGGRGQGEGWGGGCYYCGH